MSGLASPWQNRPAIISAHDYNFTVEDLTGTPITALSSIIWHGNMLTRDAALCASHEMRLTRMCVNLQADDLVEVDDLTLELEIRKSTDCEGSFSVIWSSQFGLDVLETGHQCFCTPLDPTVLLEVCDLWKPTGRILSGSLANFYIRFFVFAELQ